MCMCFVVVRPERAGLPAISTVHIINSEFCYDRFLVVSSPAFFLLKTIEEREQPRRPALSEQAHDDNLSVVLFHVQLARKRERESIENRLRTVAVGFILTFHTYLYVYAGFNVFKKLFFLLCQPKHIRTTWDSLQDRFAIIYVQKGKEVTCWRDLVDQTKPFFPNTPTNLLMSMSKAM